MNIEQTTQRLTARLHTEDARLALLHAIYLQVGLDFEQARAAALADYECSFSGGEALAA